MPAVLHKAGAQNVRFLSNIFWCAYERQNWNLVCAALELLCASIMRQKAGFHVPHTRFSKDVSTRPGVHNWPGNHNIISMLQHAVNMRHIGKPDIPQMIIHGLQSLVHSSPGIQELLSFAHAHLPVAKTPGTSGCGYGFIQQQDLDTNSLSRPGSLYANERRRARTLVATQNVYDTLREMLGEATWRLDTPAQNVSNAGFAVCAGIGAWGPLSQSAGSVSSSQLLASNSDLEFLWEDCVKMLQEECKTSGSFEAKLLLLHLGSMSGKAVAPLLPAQLRLHHTDSQKLDRLYELASFVDRNSKDNLFPGQPPGNKRKRSVSLNPEPPSQVRKSVSTGSSRPLRDTFQANSCCCATLQEVLKSEGLSPQRLRMILLHLDNAFLTPCVGGAACSKHVLAEAVRCLHSQCSACMASIQELQAQPSNSEGIVQDVESDDRLSDALVAWIEMVLLVRERSWWGLVGNAASSLLAASRNHACRLLGRDMTAQDVLNCACLWHLMQANTDSLEAAAVVAGMLELGLEVPSDDAAILVLQELSQLSNTVGPLISARGGGKFIHR